MKFRLGKLGIPVLIVAIAFSILFVYTWECTPAYGKDYELSPMEGWLQSFFMPQATLLWSYIVSINDFARENPGLRMFLLFLVSLTPSILYASFVVGVPVFVVRLWRLVIIIHETHRPQSDG